MKKLFGRKHKEEETASDSSLGRNNRTPQNDNPYAQNNADSYASNSYSGSQSSYQQPLGSQSSFRTTPSGSSSTGRPGLPSGPRSGTPSRQQPQNYGAEPPQYTGAPKNGSGYSDEKLGSSVGYGANRYDAGSSGYDNQSNNRYGSQRAGGYGGFDKSPRDSTPSVPPAQYSATRPGGGWDAQGSQDEYINPEDMTEEQLEDAQVRDLKRQAHDTRQDTKRTLNNAIEKALEAKASGEASWAMLAEQSERLDRIERGADAAISRARLGGEGVSKLDKLNSTPFFVPVSTKKNRLADEERQIRREMEDKEAKEETRRAQYERDMNIRQVMGASGKPKLLGAGKADKYTFEDDDGTEAADEEEINANIDVLSDVVGGMQFVANGIGAHLSADPKQPERITEKMMKADRKVTAAKAKMEGIH